MRKTLRRVLFAVAYVAVAALVMLPASAGAPASGATLSPSQKLRALAPARCGKLRPPSSGMYFGAQTDFYYYAPSVTDEEDHVRAWKINDFEQLVRHKIAWAYFTQHWFKGLAFPRASVLTVWRNGQIPFIRLQPHTGNLYGPPPNQVYPEQTFSLQHIIDGEFDQPLRAWADAAGEADIPILVEFGTEINGDWGPWNAKWNGAGQTDGYGDPTYPDGAERYRDAYRHLVTLFRQEGTTNVTWFFHVDAYRQYDWWNELKWYYPGDDYVDWLGISNYGSCCDNLNPVQGFREKLDASLVYDDLARISAQPMAVLETGVVENPTYPKSAWTRDAFTELHLGRYRRIRGVAVWQSSPGGDFNVSVDTSPEALAAFRKVIADPFFGAKPRFTGDCRPAAPTGLVARRTRGLVSVKWRTRLDSTSYEIWRGSRRLGTSVTGRYVDRQPRHGQATYRLRGRNPLGVGPFSRAVKAR